MRKSLGANDMRFASAAITIWALAGTLNAAEAPKNEGSKTEGPEVQVRIANYDEIMTTIEKKQGKVVVMDCWSTWCEPCIKEFPRLVKLHQEYGPKKLACLSLSFDYEGTGKPEDVQEDVLAFLKKQQASFENLLSSDEAESLLKKLDLPSIPAVYVFDRNGKLAERFDDSHNTSGKFSYDDVEKLVAKLLKE